MEGSTTFCQKKILEYSVSFCGEMNLPWNGIELTIKGQSYYVTHKTNTEMKLIYAKQTFYYKLLKK